MKGEPRQQPKVPERLGAVIVRPVEQDEVPRWLELMRAHHYLGFGKSAGKRILYVATLDGQWVAQLAWAAAALNVQCRDQWIGWDKVAKRHRLQQVTNNTRFLILPGPARANLASHVLAKNLRRLADDWHARHGHGLLLAETFVDPSRFRGTCYIAQGWTVLGETRGFGHHPQGTYERHGQPKTMLVRPLVRDARERLRSPLFEDSTGVPRLMLDVGKLPIEGEGGLFDAMLAVPSVRQRWTATYPQYKLLALATCAMLSGARTHYDIFRYMKSLTPAQLKPMALNPAKLPSRWTFWRVLNRIDAEMFDRHVGEWLARVWRDDALTIAPQIRGGTLPLLTSLRRG
jgi:hypothetical protein